MGRYPLGSLGEVFLAEGRTQALPRQHLVFCFIWLRIFRARRNQEDPQDSQVPPGSCSPGTPCPLAGQLVLSLRWLFAAVLALSSSPSSLASGLRGTRGDCDLSGPLWVLRGRRLWCWSWRYGTLCGWRSSIGESSWSWCRRIFGVEALLVSPGRVERIGDLQALACLWQASVLDWAVPYEMPCLSAVEASRVRAVGLNGFHAVLYIVHPLLHLRRGCSCIKLRVWCLIAAEAHCLFRVGRLFSYCFEWSPLWPLSAAESAGLFFESSVHLSLPVSALRLS